MTMLFERPGAASTGNSLTTAGMREGIGMPRASKRIFPELVPPGASEFFSAGHAYRLDPGRPASLDQSLAAGEGAATEGSAIASPIRSSDEPGASDLQGAEKPVPFGLHCITDEKLLMLMAQDSVNGRLAALLATGSPLATSVADEPSTVPIRWAEA